MAAILTTLLKHPAVYKLVKEYLSPGIEDMGALKDIYTPPPQSLEMYRAPAHSKPEYRGAAPDRTFATPLRYKPKKLSSRMTRSLEALRDPENPARQLINEHIRHGMEIGGRDWYNTEELRDWFVAELGTELGDAEWREFMYLIGSASPGSKVPANIGNASAMRARLIDATPVEGTGKTVGEVYAEALLAAKGIEDVRAVSKSRQIGHGHLTQGAQELIASRLLQGRFSMAPETGVAPSKGSSGLNPKPVGFSHSLIGGRSAIAADLHFTRMMAMSSKDPDWLSTGADVGKTFKDDVVTLFPDAEEYFTTRIVGDKVQDVFKAKAAVQDGVVDLSATLPSKRGSNLPGGVTVGDSPIIWAEAPNANEYAAFEEFMHGVAEEFGLTPAQAQASLWMGGSDLTNVAATSRKTFMEILRDRAASTAEKTGLSSEEVMQNFIRKGALLSIFGAPTAAVLTGEEKAI